MKIDNLLTNDIELWDEGGENKLWEGKAAVEFLTANYDNRSYAPATLYDIEIVTPLDATCQDGGLVKWKNKWFRITSVLEIDDVPYPPGATPTEWLEITATRITGAPDGNN